MFDNIGEKIKTLAKVLTILGSALSVLYGLVLMVSDEGVFFSGIFIMIFGSLLSWVGSFTLYGFGEVINQLEDSNENSRKLYRMLKKEINVLIYTSQHADKVAEMNNSDESDTDAPVSMPKPIEKMAESKNSGHKWLCYSCKRLRDSTPCPYCGNE